LILFASPEGAASQWVNQEVAYWLEHKGSETLLIALTGGELVWSVGHGGFAWHEGLPLPPVLAGALSSEPKWVDLRAYRCGADVRDARFIDHAADFAAAIHGIPKEDLLSQEVRQQRQSLALAWSASGTLAVLIALAGWQWWQAESAKRLAEAQRGLAIRNFNVAKQAAGGLALSAIQVLKQFQGTQVNAMREMLTGSQAILDGLAQVAPDDRDLQYSRASGLAELADVFSRSGDVARGRSASRESVATMRKLASAAPDNLQWWYGTASSLGNLGNIQQRAGDRSGSLVAYEESLAILRKLVAANPQNSQWRSDLGSRLRNVAELRLTGGDLAGALLACEESLAVIRDLGAAKPDNREWQHLLGLSLTGLGDIRVGTGNPRGALAAFEEGLAIARTLAGDGISRVYNVSATLVRIGAVYLSLGEHGAALDAYAESLNIMRSLAASDPNNRAWSYGVSISLEQVGEARRAIGDRSGALAAFQESLAIRRKFAAIDPADAEVERGVTLSLDRIGDIRTSTGDRGGALAAYSESLATRRKLAAADSSSVQSQSDLAIALAKLGIVSDAREAHVLLRESLAIVQTLAAEGRLTSAQQGWPELIGRTIARLPPEGADSSQQPPWGYTVQRLN
jgi:tetratricopeptide (TPR) repeat protein